MQIGEEGRKSVGYGGKGDKLHLGGFTEVDPHGISATICMA